MLNLVIMDIDGTLLQAKGAGARAMYRLMRELYALDNPFANIAFAGRTDRSLIEEACHNHHLGLPDWSAVIPLLARFTAEELKTDPGFLLPGVLSILPMLFHSTQIALVLGTGNFRPCAFLKLSAHGIDRFFSNGGFGEDGADRVDVIKAAIGRAREYYAMPFAHTVVVGDTPLDIKAAHEAEVACIGVGTGSFSPTELLTYSADAAIPDMTHLAATLRSRFQFVI